MRAKQTGIAIDSMLLTAVKVVTAVLGLLVTKLLSVHFSLQDYGTYSQALLIVSTATSFSILGLTDASNYFYNNNCGDEKKQSDYMATIFGLQCMVGSLCAIIIVAMSQPIISYFGNEQLHGILYVIAFMPLMENLIAMLQVLFISIGRAKVIAVRNFLISVARLLIVFVACFVTDNIRTVIYVLLVLDVVQVVYFWFGFVRSKFAINFKQFKKSLLPEILKFSIPMAVYILTNSLSRDVDKYVISFFSDTETLAIYTNAAKNLPFDLITASFLTVLIPVMTQYIGKHQLKNAVDLFKSYLQLGYLATWILTAGAIFCSTELMEFLYDEKYLAGLSVFIVYLFVDMTRFANTSLILVASGKTRFLMYSSIVALVLNLIFNVLAFKAFGIVGPAITTLLITIGLVLMLLYLGARELETSLFSLFDGKEMVVLVIELMFCGIFTLGIRTILLKWSVNNVLVLILCYGFFVGIMFLLNGKKITRCLKSINQFR